MTTRALLHGSPLLAPALALALALATSACGGAIDTTGTSSSGSGTTSPGGSSQAPNGPAPPSTNNPVPPNGPPGAFNAKASGCSNFTVFAGDATGRRFLIVQADKKALGMVGLGDTATVDLATTSNGPSTRVFIDTYDRVPAEQMYCTDYISEPYNPVRTTAVQGLATFTITAVGREGGVYEVSVTLRNVVIQGASGAREPLPDVTYTNVGVGWLPG